VQKPVLQRHVEALLNRHWWQPQPTALARALQPLSALYGALLERRLRKLGSARPTPVPVVVVGNIVAGGAGKTPVVIALVQALRELGWQPGVVSRGYGRDEDAFGPGAVAALANSDPRRVGDEPLLIHLRTGAPVWVARQRVDAVVALCWQHPEVDVIVADDGLQHRALARAAEVLVMDERGIGNGLLLPAGPLREPMPLSGQLPPQMRVLYSGPGTPPLRPSRQVQRIHRSLGAATLLQAWWQRDSSQAVPLTELQGRPLWALAGLATPENFFAMLESSGLQISRHPQADHEQYLQSSPPPWPADTPDVVTTEKDAVKLQSHASGNTRIWVVGLDLALPGNWVAELSSLLRASAASAAKADTPRLPATPANSEPPP